MASDKAYLDFILEQLSALENVTYRPMMGEYLLYVGGKIVGGIYDDRLLIKPADAARRLMPSAPPEKPYEGAKDMLLVQDVDDGEFLCGLFAAVAAELPPPKRKK